MSARGEFSSRIGFVLAAAGSAVGLGNIWGFPTQVASNGGAAFVFVYILLAFLLAYPVLMAELIIGRATHSKNVTVSTKKFLASSCCCEEPPTGTPRRAFCPQARCQRCLRVPKTDPPDRPAAAGSPYGSTHRQVERR